ncbi:related to Na-K-Cl cotransporter [Melanopsichium pennsylvanicum]|uniref:Related to Na-K-Cl cotransporter n=2 Tax=Melanopsichium pennsylvanicum TaxID=63383 RepID=A0AAJ5C7L1_9BASI|nr:related to bumetanide-sensitive Na-K-Cl cotransport protein [Melanopsichium pennsylvanicum 4]SNX87031.1 related to Na-K-Cl cotransporter [Melanopsichium pennsylvanicum]
MSHFVSSHTSQDFDSLQHQLLRREPLHDATSPEHQELHTQHANHTSAHLGISTSLANRRRRDNDQADLTDDNRSQRVPSLYSRRNSPELPDPNPSRPRSVATNANLIPDISNNAQIESADYFSKPTTSSTRPRSTPYHVDLDTGKISGDPFISSTTSSPNSFVDHARLHPASSPSPSQFNSSTSTNPQVVYADEPYAGPSSPNLAYHASTVRPRRIHKGVSFSDSNAGPGESGHHAQTAKHYRRPPRSNSGFQDAAYTNAQSGPAQLPRTKSLGMISPAEMAPRKLGTWDGVFMPVSLNILGIILFLRFGFILGQAGLLGALFLLIVSYAIDTLTAMSLSAISTNGQVRGGGAYYLISRSLGPEFGGSIGLIFFAGQALNTAMNVLGFVETLTDAFGESRGPTGFLPEGPWYSFFYGSIVLLVSAIVCLVGSKLFARATLALALVLSVAILSIPISSFAVKPFIDDDRGAYYTGWSWDTLRGNLFPLFTSGAAGSSTGADAENWQSVFGVLFPAVTGILAGASMSGDLRKPSKSIPKGTNYSLVFTFLVYFLSFVVFAGTIERESFYVDVGIVSDVALSPQVITFGALASTAFSALMGVMACGKVLQAIARDNLLLVLDVFAQGTEVSDTPIYAVLVTYIFCQAILFVDSVNTIAQLVTMTTLLTFGTLSFATCALKAGGAPSFRPSFKYWNIWTAAGGAISCFGAMLFTNPAAAAACIIFAVGLFVMIHIFSPPKPWGDVTRNITYHFVRKYLLRLDERKGHVKYWRPQILLLANNPRSEWNLIIFCNSLKKGALYVLGHVLKGEFTECLAELRKQQVAWLKLVDLTGIKSFVDVVIAKDEREGARNLIISCGLGGMRPNIVVMGYPSDMRHPAKVARSTSGSGHRSDGSEITIRGLSWPQRRHRAVDIGSLPTDVARKETPIKPTTYVGIMEDSLALNKALAIAYGFDLMQPPHPATSTSQNGNHAQAQEQYIDLWPIQIASPDADESHAWDTYTMVLHLGTILSFTSSWKSHKLRVSVFVEHTSEMEQERKRIRALLDNLRIPASLRVFCLADRSVTTYQTIVHGSNMAVVEVDEALRGDPWWETLKELRRNEERRARTAAKRKSQALSPAKAIPSSSTAFGQPQDGPRKQSKREQKLFGVSLPAEHLAFHKQNIRLGLAHPRARRDDGEDGSFDSDSDSDSDSDFEQELAMLSEDDDWLIDSPGGNGRRGLAIRRASTLEPSSNSNKMRKNKPRSYSIGGTAGLPDDPVTAAVRTPLLGSSVSAQTGGAGVSYGTLSSSQRTATPATVKAASNGFANMLGTSYASTDSSMTPRAPVGAYGARGNVSGKSNEDEDGNDESTLKASERQKLQAELKQREQPIKTTPTESFDDVDTVTPRQKMNSNNRKCSYASSTSSDSGKSCSGSSGAEYDAKGRLVTPQVYTTGGKGSVSVSRHSRARSEETRRNTCTSPSGVAMRRMRPQPAERVSSRATSMYSTDLPVVSFNELPNKAQYLILNELIRINSSAATGVVLTALPAPEKGTCEDELKSLRYLEGLESLFSGGPPVLGVHAKTLTMTMSL